LCRIRDAASAIMERGTKNRFAARDAQTRLRPKPNLVPK